MLKRIPLSIAGVLLIGVLSACSRTLYLPAPNGAALRLVTFIEKPGTSEVDSKEVSLSPNSTEYQRLQEWVAHNQKGWWPSYAASPAGGVVVHSGDLHLQFVRGTVFAFTGHGHFQKEIAEKDYAFLKAAAGI
jgi:hypothetical protein